MEFTQDERIYSLDSVLDGINGYENKTVREIIDNGNGNKELFKLIKRGYRFTDEVLSECNISREIRDEKVYLEIAHHAGTKLKTLKKDTAAYDEIVESLSHVEVEEEQKNEEELDEVEDFFEHDDE